HLLGMIIAGILIGPFGFNLLTRDSSIILSGTAGLLYIMFLAGLEIDMNDFKKNAGKSTVLGIYGFIIPMILGTLSGIYILKFSVITSILMASMFASHTLITYPIVSKLGIIRNQAVNISVGSTLITNTLALLVLAIVVGMSAGALNSGFWLKLTMSFIGFFFIIMFLFPIIARWFFKRFSDNISQFIFVLVMVFLGAVLSKAAGIEAIIGAFLAGLALNRLIPRTSPLMNRIDFVGNAIFIPFFLIGVGMLINYKAFFSGYETLLVALVMSVIATLGKFISAWLTQKNFGFTRDERKLIFGLTNAQAAATLAAVLIGYNIILDYSSTGEPIRLLGDSILNGTVIMILVTCTIASFATQKGARNVALHDRSEVELSNTEKILIPLSNPNTIEELTSLSTIIKSKRNTDGLYALNIISSENAAPEDEKKAREILEKAEIAASSVDIKIKSLLRYDIDPVTGISNVIKEQGITDLILGLHISKGISDSFFGNLTSNILVNSNITTYVYKPYQPVSTVKRHIVVVPENAEYETGFSFWLAKIWNIAHNTGTKIVFYTAAPTGRLIKDIHLKHPIEAEFRIFSNWDEFLTLSKEFKKDDNLIMILSRNDSVSYQNAMNRIPLYLNRYFKENNFLLIYPVQTISEGREKIDLTNPSLIKTVEKIDIIGKTIAGIFSHK
ncbi:MAG: cation:proton antiporter, partial [Bacteroidales bacterium]